MKNEDVMILAQLLTAMKDATLKLEGALNKRDAESVASAKKEILIFQKQIHDLL